MSHRAPNVHPRGPSENPNTRKRPRETPVDTSGDPSAATRVAAGNYRRRKREPDPDVWFPYIHKDGGWQYGIADPKPYTPNLHTPEGTLGLGLTHYQSPAVIWLTLMEPAIEIMIRETNIHGKQRFESGKVQRRWKDVDRAEFIAFLAIWVAQGTSPRENYKECWRDSYLNSTPHYKEIMSLQRYTEIYQNIHCENNDEAAIKRKCHKDDIHYDPMYKIRRMMDVTYEQFREARAHGSELAWDESMVRFTGRSEHIVIMDNKPDPVGFKVQSLNDTTGFALYGVVEVEKRGGYGHFTNKITDRLWEGLLQAGVLDQGCTLYTDSYYTNDELARALHTRDTYLIGVMCGRNLKNMPPVVSDKNSRFSAKMSRDERCFLYSEPITFCNWKDSKNVVGISTRPDVVNRTTVTKRKLNRKHRDELRKELGINNAERKIQFADGIDELEEDAHMKAFQEPPNKRSKNTDFVIPVKIPLMFQLFNLHKGGTDKQDQYVSLHSRKIRSSIWYMPLAKHLLDVGMVNTYIILRDGISVLTPSSAGRFCNALVRNIVARDLVFLSQLFGYELPSKGAKSHFALGLSSRERALMRLPPLTKTQTDTLTNAATQEDGSEEMISVNDALDHMPAPDTRILPKQKFCVARCTHTNRKQAPMKCLKCDVNLCVPCFRPYHVDKLKK